MREGAGLLALAAAFEGGLALLACALGAAAGVRPWETIRWGGRAVAWGVAATLPMLGLLLILLRLGRWGPLARILRLVDELLGPLARSASAWDLFALCALAGIGEELLFRGLLQAWLARSFGSGGAVLLAGAVFGLAHAVTPLYALLAGAIGLYLGWAWVASGNLLVPIVAHALYDFVALGWLARDLRRREARGERRDAGGLDS